MSKLTGPFRFGQVEVAIAIYPGKIVNLPDPDPVVVGNVGHKTDGYYRNVLGDGELVNDVVVDDGLAACPSDRPAAADGRGETAVELEACRVALGTQLDRFALPLPGNKDIDTVHLGVGARFQRRVVCNMNENRSRAEHLVAQITPPDVAAPGACVVENLVDEGSPGSHVVADVALPVTSVEHDRSIVEGIVTGSQGPLGEKHVGADASAAGVQNRRPVSAKIVEIQAGQRSSASGSG